eukprot:TRINITY_DN140_c0_g1_i10.p1 TRINITY_DN140_c0_g1~~TRINITY_DN140_c0_g1_i10.p1  ORF type:complete len:172 (-),score=28.25 TRINITY_DN140_c0_g1_i10:106-621(-)
MEFEAVCLKSDLGSIDWILGEWTMWQMSLPPQISLPASPQDKIRHLLALSRDSSAYSLLAKLSIELLSQRLIRRLLQSPEKISFFWNVTGNRNVTMRGMLDALSETIDLAIANSALGIPVNEAGWLIVKEMDPKLQEVISIYVPSSRYREDEIAQTDEVLAKENEILELFE